MTTPVIIDAIVVVILVGFCLFGARRGLFQAFAGLVTMIVALVGAGIIAASFSGPVTGLVAPLIEEHITQQVDEALGLAPGEMPEADVQEDEALEGFGIEDLLALLGVDQDVRDSIAQQAQETVRDTGVSVASAVVESIAGTMIYGALFLIAVDAGARRVFDAEVPVSVLTSLIGAPAFIYLLRRTGGVKA